MKIAVFFFTLFFLACFDHADAAEICAPRPAMTLADADYVIDQSVAGCLGGVNDRAPITRELRGDAFVGRLIEVQQQLQADPAEAAAPSTEQMAALMRVGAEKILADLDQHRPPAVAELQAIDEQLRAALASIRRHAANLLLAQRPAVADDGTRLFKLANPKTFASDAESEEAPIIHFSDLDAKAQDLSFVDGKGPLAAVCTDPGSAERGACDAAGDYVAEVLRLARLTHLLLANTAAKLSLLRTAGESRLIDARWNSYFDKARSQTPLELLANGWLWRRGRHSTGGFAAAPGGQMILLHPGVAMEYVSAAPDGEQFKPAVHLEALGYNWLRYDDEGDIGRAIGFSLGVLYADRAGVPDVRPAAFFIWDNLYSLGVTYGSGDVGVLLSADLLKLGSGISRKWKDRLRIGLGILD